MQLNVKSSEVSTIVNDLFFFFSKTEFEALYYDYRCHNHCYKSISCSSHILGSVLCLSSRAFFPRCLSFSCFFCSIRNRLWLICGVCDCKNLRLFAFVKIRFFAYIYRNRLLLFLLLSVFYHKIYVLNVIACTKSHVNFISFVFGARILLFYFSLSYFIFTAIFWAASTHTDNKKAATTTSTNSSTLWQDQTIKTNPCTRRRRRNEIQMAMDGVMGSNQIYTFKMKWAKKKSL